MDREQYAQFFKLMKTAYPSTDLDADRIKLWKDKLADLNYFVAMSRLNKHIDTSKFPPTIAEILNPEEAAKSRGRQETDGLSPAAIMGGGVSIYMGEH